MRDDFYDIPKTILQEHAKPGMSPRYVHVSSVEVIRQMERQGWTLAAAKASKTRTRDPLFARHALDFRQNNAPESFGMVPRLLVMNSHDGSCNAFAAAGFFRPVSATGMVIGDLSAQLVTRHSKVNGHDFVVSTLKLAEGFDKHRKTLERWNKLKLSIDHRLEYARLASALRFPDCGFYKSADLLKSRREEEDAVNLLTVFQRVHENATKGGQKGVSPSGMRFKSRPIKSIRVDIHFNVQLWRMTEELSGLWR